NFDLMTAHDGGYTYREDFDVRSWSPFSERIDLDRPMRTGLWEPYLRWYKSGGTQGQRPPPDMLESLSEVARIYEQEYMTEKDAAKAKEAARKIARLWADNVWRLAAVGSSPMPLVLSNRLWNLPSFIDAPPHGYWLRAGVYAYQLAIGE
ncbi:MAG: hypothetical protein Q8O57_03035, partial [Kiritimatiellota bacterium]|nr:hypothetical protein [Kiritimatiellota bacterium]